MSPKGLVLVSGANGYIACWTVAAFLEAGYAVRGTVRSRKSADELVKALSGHVDKGLLEIVEVPDVTIPGAFDSALEGVTVVAHLASPVSLTETNIELIHQTAIEGTLSIAESALKHPTIKSFILMSSIAAVVTYSQARTYTEADWNDEAVEVVEKMGSEAGGLMVYTASKVKAERAFWKWVEEKKPAFKTVSLNPPWVAGPPLFLPASPDKISTTTEFIWQLLSGQDYPAGPAGYGHHVDVRDLARLHIFVTDHPEVFDGQRVIAGGVPRFGVPQRAADILREAYPERRHIIKEGTPGEGYLPDGSTPPGWALHIDSSRAREATGQEWITFEKMVLDAAKMFEAYL